MPVFMCSNIVTIYNRCLPKALAMKSKGADTLCKYKVKAAVPLHKSVSYNINSSLFSKQHSFE
jgi:hypothetical protein